VQVTDDFANVGRATTNAEGTFDLSAKIPAPASAGSTTVRATGRTSFATAQATFTVT
jgi:hypothetical protein